MRYYVIMKNGECFQTEWFDEENHWNGDEMFMAIDGNLYTTDGKEWKGINEDHL